MKKAFTLIELLIVVAIIAILAAIAVPNFLEAQTRAKVSRAKSDLRTMATAIESYNIDYNKPPPQSIGGTPGNPFNAVYGIGTGTLTQVITTPVAYLSTFTFRDPFVNYDASVPVDEQLYTYQSYQWKWAESGQPTSTPTKLADTVQEGGNAHLTGTQWSGQYGRWMTLSVGPDRTFYNTANHLNDGLHGVNFPYDPTNGTVTFGNIFRSQKEPEQRTFVPNP